MLTMSELYFFTLFFVIVIARATATAASTAQRLVAMGQSSGMMNGDRESVASEENMSISGNQRYMVMQSLARSGGIVPPAAPTPKETVQSSVVRLQYSATPADIDDQLEEEFREECSKYGPVIRVQLLPLAEGQLRIFIHFVSSIGKLPSAISSFVLEGSNLGLDVGSDSIWIIDRCAFGSNTVARPSV